MSITLCFALLELLDPVLRFNLFPHKTFGQNIYSVLLFGQKNLKGSISEEKEGPEASGDTVCCQGNVLL